MIRFLIGVAGFVLLFASFVFPQETKKVPSKKSTTSKISLSDPTFPGYKFEIRIDSDKTSHLEIFTGYEFEDLDNGRLRKALMEYLSMQSPAPGQKPVGPKVVIKPDETLDMNTIIDVAKTVRVAGSSQVQIVTPDGQELAVPVDPRFVKNREVKPNPLFLIAALDGRKMTLNNENCGDLANLSPLITKLKNIFHEREINGVFREGSYEIEKTVYIKIGTTAKFTDLMQIAKALEDSGAGPLFVQIDKDAELNVVLTRP